MSTEYDRLPDEPYYEKKLYKCSITLNIWATTEDEANDEFNEILEDGDYQTEDIRILEVA